MRRSSPTRARGDHHPAEHVEKLKAPVTIDADVIDSNVLTPTEINRLLDPAKIPRRDGHGRMIGNNNRLLFKVAIFTGMRSGEIRGLQWADVDWNSRQLYARCSFKDGEFFAPKTATSIRRIELPESIIRELKERPLASPKRKLDLVFSNTAGKPIGNPIPLQRAFCPALRRAGIRKIRFHDLRHKFASLLIANEEDIVQVSRPLGHANSTITLRVHSHMLPTEHHGSSERLIELVSQSDRGSVVSIARATR